MAREETEQRFSSSGPRAELVFPQRERLVSCGSGMTLTDSFARVLVDLLGVTLPDLVDVIRLVEDGVGREGNFRSTNVLLVLVRGDADERRFSQQETFAVVAD